MERVLYPILKKYPARKTLIFVSVPDKETRELMGYFYDDWLKTGDAGRAS